MKVRRPTLLGYALLSLIRHGPSSGYALRKAFKTTPLGHFSSSPGSIYPALKRLEKYGLIKGLVEHRETLRPRKVFHLTNAGKAKLKVWLVKPIGREDVIWRMDELLLRFAFMTGQVSQGEAVRFLDSFKKAVVEYLKELTEIHRDSSLQMPIHSRLALEHGIEIYKAHRRWAETALKEFH